MISTNWLLKEQNKIALSNTEGLKEWEPKSTREGKEGSKEPEKKVFRSKLWNMSYVADRVNVDASYKRNHMVSSSCVWLISLIMGRQFLGSQIYCL